jgi:hypothetical protein
MKMPVSEIADRYTILQLKSLRLSAEHAEELTQYHEAVSSVDGLTTFLGRLLDVNSKIWDLEAEIRQGHTGHLSLEEVGRRALAIRDLNRVRIGIKNEIAIAFSSGFVERKIEHLSEHRTSLSTGILHSPTPGNY